MVTWSTQNGIAVITVDNPPVNALSTPVRSGLLAALTEATDDPSVIGIVVRCAGRTFIAGADLKELDRPIEAPALPQVIERLEQSSKPVVAAIHGTALGGGLEVALACHYRIAAADARVGLPEVKLGLIPGSGGTQRLPRLIGVERAIRVIVDGHQVAAREAHEWGAIDEVCEDGDLAGAAVRRAITLAAASTIRKVRDLPISAPPAGLFVEAAKRLGPPSGRTRAAHSALDAIRAAVELPFDQGMRLERELFLALRVSEESAALRYVFSGEREVARPPGLPLEIKARTVNQVAVIGAGTMGGGIAMSFANAGIPVTLLEVDAAALNRGMTAVRSVYQAAQAKGRLTAAQMETRLASIRPTLTYDDLREADVIIEAVFEDLAIKREVFLQLDDVARPQAILATNTSYLDVSTIASYTRRPANVVGMHFFSPAHLMRLLEVVRTESTAPDVMMTAMQLGRQIGKIAVLVGGSDGFVGNRMLAQRTREAYFLVEEGALPQQVDRVLVDFGFPMGPFAVSDLAGVDIGWRNRKARAHLRDPRVRDSTLLDKIGERGRFGQKTGAGWYRYAPGTRVPIPDPEVEALIIEHSRELGITRRPISDEEILHRCLYALINEGGRILDEKVASREVDVDMIWVHGYGFPAYRGGPLFYARTCGYRRVLDGVLALQARFGEHYWHPSQWLLRHVSAS